MKEFDKVEKPCPVKRTMLAEQVLLVCAAMAGSVMTMPAFAQQKANSDGTVVKAQIEEVVVTARKRNEKLLEVPISIVSVSEKEIRASGTQDLTDVKAMSGFEFNQYNSTASSGRSAGMIVMRGLAPATTLTQDASGSLFVDGILISTGQASVSTNDVARIEVLKGPQNAYFGRSTFGGAVNYITKNPANTFQGRLNSTINNRGSHDSDLTIEGPIMEGVLKGRLTLAQHDKAAVLHASDGGALGAEKTQSATGTLFLTPDDKTWFRFRGTYQEDDDSAPASGLLSAKRMGDTSCTTRTLTGADANGNSVSYNPGVPYFCNGLPGYNSDYVDSNTTLPTQFQSVWKQNSLNAPFLGDVPTLKHMGLQREITRLSIQGGRELPGNNEFAFNIGYNRADYITAWDLDRSTNMNFFNILGSITRDLTLDARLTTDKSLPVRGLIGMSRFTQHEQVQQIDWNAFAGAPAMTLSANYRNEKSTVPAVYGSVDWDVTKDITATFEGRWQKDKIVTSTNRGVVFQSEVSNFLPRVMGKYKFGDGSSVYVSASKGVQPLRLNSSYAGLNAAQQAYVQSTVGGSLYSPQPVVKVLELGIKQRLFDNRLQYALAVYDQKWENRATSTAIFNPVSCGTTTLTAACPLSASGTNVYFPNDAKIQGLELSVDAVITDNWSAGFYLDYKDAKWDKLYAAGNSSNSPTAAVFNRNAVYFNGSELAKVPKWTFSANSTYRFPSAFKGMDGYVRGDLFYNGKMWDSEPNVNKLPDYYRMNLRFGLEKKDLTTEFFIKNVFNDKHWTYAYRLADLSITPLTNFANMGAMVGVPDGRELGIRVSIGF